MGKGKGFAAAIVALLLLLCLSSCQESESSVCNRAEKLLSEEKYTEAAELLDKIPGYPDAEKLSAYVKTVSAAEDGYFNSALSSFKALGDYKDSPQMITYYTGRQYESQADNGNWSVLVTAAEYYDMIKAFRDSAARAENCRRSVYDEAVRLAANGEYAQSAGMLGTLGDFGDSRSLMKYYTALKLEKEGKYAGAAAAFTELRDYSDSAEQAEQVLARGYEKAETLEKAGKTETASLIFAGLGDYRDASDRAGLYWYELALRKREEKDWYAAIQAFEKAGDYSDAATQILETKYLQALYKRDLENWEEAESLFLSLGNYRNAATEGVSETVYTHASVLEQNGDQEGAYDLFSGLGDYKDAFERANEPYYKLGFALRDEEDWDGAAAAFMKAGAYSDAAEQVKETYYQQASALEEAGDQEGAYSVFIGLGDYRDAFERANKPYYDLGMERRTAGDWAGAVAAFAHAGTYMNAPEQILATYYAEGESRLALKDWESARTAFAKAGEYSDAATQILATYYAEGEALLAERNWDGARSAFGNAGVYSDAAERITAVTFAEAEEKFAAKDWDGAIGIYSTIGDNDEAKYRIEECRYEKTIALYREYQAGEASAEDVLALLKEIGDKKLFMQARGTIRAGSLFREVWAKEFIPGNTVLLGEYDQDGDPGNGKEPIRWKVLNAEEGEALLLAEKAIDTLPYKKDTTRTDILGVGMEEIWQQSEIRRWLEDPFMDSFTEQERGMLEAGIPDITLFLRYLKEETGEEAWWLRNGILRADRFLFPDDLGTAGGVRPVIRVQLEKGPADAWIEEHYAFR